ncbi:hypothetical protein TNCV_3807441 [Trichonephila clavipes]|nr:hypothetical protein TNCV_3807441 [Trichonephila clavipes]
MAYLAKGNKPDLLSVCEEMGVEVDTVQQGGRYKKFILNSEFYVEEEVKIIDDRVISDEKERERNKQEEKEREERSKQEEREGRSKQEEREERSKQEERKKEKGKEKSEWLERPDNMN